MKTLLTTIVLLVSIQLSLKSQTTLEIGDLVFTAYQSDSPDHFKFVLLKNIEAGTVISFTDHGWLAAGGFRMNEGILTWESGSAYPAGTEIIIFPESEESKDASGNSAGTVMNRVGTNNPTNFSVKGDQIFAFQGMLPSGTGTGLISGIQMNGNGWDTNAGSSSTSAKPPVLTDGETSISFMSEDDNGYYSGSKEGLSPEEIRTAVLNEANWTKNTNPITAALTVENFALASIPTMGQWALFILALLMASISVAFIHSKKAILSIA